MSISPDKKTHNNAVSIMKSAFLEFFRKLIPSMIDPQNYIKRQWTKFKDLLLTEDTKPETLLEFAKKMKLAPLAKLNLKKLDEVKQENDYYKYATLSQRDLPDQTMGMLNISPMRTKKFNKTIHLNLLEQVKKTYSEFNKNTSVLGIIFENTFQIKSPPKQLNYEIDSDELKEESFFNAKKQGQKEHSLHIKKRKEK